MDARIFGGVVIPKRRSRKVTLRMPDELHAKLQRRAHEDANSVGSTACRLIARALAQEPPAPTQDAREREGEA